MEEKPDYVEGVVEIGLIKKETEIWIYCKILIRTKKRHLVGNERKGFKNILRPITK